MQIYRERKKLEKLCEQILGKKSINRYKKMIFADFKCNKARERQRDSKRQMKKSRNQENPKSVPDLNSTWIPAAIC